VPDFNNRVYVRVTTPDGQPLPGAEITVKRAWDAMDEGVTTRADEDAVGALQIDPGKPVSVVIPPPPLRASARKAVHRVQLGSVEDLLWGDGIGTEASLVLGAWARSLEECAAHVIQKTATPSLLVEVSPSGQVGRVLADESVVARCIAGRLRGLRGPVGQEHLYALSFTVEPASGASVEPRAVGWPEVPGGFQALVTEASLEARACVLDLGNPAPVAPGSKFLWTLQRGSRAVQGRWMDEPRADGLSASRLACVKRAFAGMTLREPVEREMRGVVHFRILPGQGEAGAERVSTVRSGYELLVSARRDGVELGSTRALLNPGTVPTLRLRPEEPVLRPGESVTLKILRGPDYSGKLPDEKMKFDLLQGGEDIADLEYDPKSRTLRGKIPDRARGLLTVDAFGARAILLVPREASLSVELEPDKAVYRPGETARLTLRTRQGERPVEAAVGLAGVDEALGQLAPLVGPDDFGRVTVRATLARSAFGSFDARALLLGRIRGRNALLATLQRVADIPRAASLEEGTRAVGAVEFDPGVPLAERFHDILADARLRVAAWEEGAPEGETLTAHRMVALWEEVLKERRKAKRPVDDAYGETLHLSRLPQDLLVLADPRNLVSDARHLPEDVENWSLYVAKEAP
jgi:hypothetical protein